MRTFLFVALLLALAAGLHARPAVALEAVSFEPGLLPEEYRSDVMNYVLSTNEHALDWMVFDFEYSDYVVDDRNEDARIELFWHRINWALYDLDDDGTPELIVRPLIDCGQSGCDGVIFRREGGRLVELGGDRWVHDDGIYVASRRPPGGGYRAFLAGSHFHRWNGTKYEVFCWIGCKSSVWPEVTKEISKAETDSLRRFFYDVYEGAELFRSGKLSLKNLIFRRFDLNRDGKPELFVSMQASEDVLCPWERCAIRCPWGSCGDFIFQGRGGQWQLIGWNDDSYLNDEVTLGYHVVQGLAQKLVWNGSAYETVRCDDFCGTKKR